MNRDGTIAKFSGYGTLSTEGVTPIPVFRISKRILTSLRYGTGDLIMETLYLEILREIMQSAQITGL
jgi:hypothetical protein